VQFGPAFLGQRAVGRLLNEHVAEAKRALERQRRAFRLDQLLPLERVQMPRKRRTGLGRHELRNRTDRELAPDDRRALEDDSLPGPEEVEPRGEKSVQRRGDAEIVGLRRLLHSESEQLLEEERVSLGGVKDPCAPIARDPLGRVAPRDKLLGLCVVQGLERQDRLTAVKDRPRWMLFHLGPRQADDEDRSALADPDNVLDEIQKGGLCPVDVFEHENEGALARELLEQAAGRPADLLDGIHLFDEADGGREASSDSLTIGQARDEGVERLHRLVRRERADHLAKRPVRDAVAVGQAASCKDARLQLHRLSELSCKSRLADAGLAHEGDEAGTPLLNSSRESFPEHGELVRASDDRRVEKERADGGITRDPDQAPCVRGLMVGGFELC
jgi:hypothetical protein